MQQFEKDKFLKDLEELKNPDLLQYKDCNIMYSKFHEKNLQINDKNIPVKKETKLKQKPWTSRAILTSIKIKHTLYKKYLQQQDIFWYERYKFYRKKISRLISKSKKKNTFGSLFKIIFKILEVHGKKLMNYSIGNQIKMMT